MQGSQALNSYVSDPDICLIAMTGSTFSIRRQTAINAVTTLTLGLAGAAAYGVFSQLAVWRTSTEYGARLKTATGQVISTAAAGNNNAQNIAAAPGAMGVARGFWTNSALTTAEKNSVKFRLHRGFVENLHRSGRDPVDLLDADWARTIARNVF